MQISEIEKNIKEQIQYYNKNIGYFNDFNDKKEKFVQKYIVDNCFKIYYIDEIYYYTELSFIKSKKINGSIHSFFIGFILNKIKDNIPNFMLVRTLTVYNNYSIIDVGNDNTMTLYEYIDKNTSIDEWENIYKQICLSLSYAYKKYKFVHNNLHLNNVHIKKLKKEMTILYDNNEEIITTNLMIIGNYNFSHIMIDNINIGHCNPEIGILPERPYPMYDIYKILIYASKRSYDIENYNLLNHLKNYLNFFNISGKNLEMDVNFINLINENVEKYAILPYLSQYDIDYETYYLTQVKRNQNYKKSILTNQIYNNKNYSEQILEIRIGYNNNKYYEDILAYIYLLKHSEDKCLAKLLEYGTINDSNITKFFINNIDFYIKTLDKFYGILNPEQKEKQKIIENIEVVSISEYDDIYRYNSDIADVYYKYILNIYPIYYIYWNISYLNKKYHDIENFILTVNEYNIIHSFINPSDDKSIIATKYIIDKLKEDYFLFKKLTEEDIEIISSYNELWKKIFNLLNNFNFYNII